MSSNSGSNDCFVLVTVFSFIKLCVLLLLLKDCYLVSGNRGWQCLMLAVVSGSEASDASSALFV